MNDYTARELKRWGAACAFIERVNKLLQDNPEYILFWRSWRINTRCFHFEDMGGEDEGWSDKWICIKEDNCTSSIFSLNEDGDKSIKQILKELKSEIKIYREVKVKL